MRVPNKLFNLCVKALTQSMDIGVMTALARTFIPHYNLHERTGIPSSVAVPNREAANQIIKDMIRNETFLDFVLLLVKVGDQGHKGRRFKIPYLRDIINGVIALGYLYDPENDMFIENQAERKTRNWGTLRQGVEYTITFLRIDIAGNSDLVRSHSEKEISQAYGTLREIVRSSVDRRDGRIWCWDGDGGLAAFFRGHKHQQAVLAGMEILHELFLYNHTINPLQEALKIRVAAHSGPFEYSEDEEALEDSETVSRVMYIEQELCEPGTMTVSEVVKMMLDSLILGRLTEFKDESFKRYYSYSLTMEEQ
jgi:class 3 adenylate cyclase